MTRWSLVPAAFLRSPHFRRRLRIIDRVSLTAAIASAAVAIAVSFALGDDASILAVYAVFPLFALVLACFIASVLRWRIVGPLSKISASHVPIWAQHIERTWWIIRMGLAGTMACLIILLLISLIGGWGGQGLFWALMYVVLMSMIGTAIVSMVTDTAIIRRHWGLNAPTGNS